MNKPLTYVDAIRTYYGKLFPQKRSERFRERFWAQFARSQRPQPNSTDSKVDGHTIGQLLAFANRAEQAKAAGDYKTYAIKAEDARFFLDCLDDGALALLPAEKQPAWLREFIVHNNKPLVPWAGKLCPVPGHCVRVSSDDPSKVAYYRSATKLLEGKQLRTTPGKYLAEFYPDLSAEDVKQASASMTAADVENLVLLETADDIVTAYEYPVSAYGNGCSCMRGEGSVRVYANPGNGLRLATLWEGEPLNSRLIARSLVRHDTTPPQYVRPYTLVGGPLAPEQFGALLQRAGYEYGNLDGVKVRRIQSGGGFVMPYIDSGCNGEQTAEDQGDHLLLGHGDINCTNTDGTTSAEQQWCDHCCEWVDCDEDEMTHVDDVGYVCESCLGSDFVYAIANWRDWDRYQGREYARTDECTYDNSTDECVLDNLVDDRGTRCERCCCYYSDSHELQPTLDSYGDIVDVCGDCDHHTTALDVRYDSEPDIEYAMDNAVVCIRDGQIAHKGDCYQRDGTWYLDKDHDEFDPELDDPDYEADKDEDHEQAQTQPQASTAGDDTYALAA